MKILHVDSNHPLLKEQLEQLGTINHEDYTSSKAEIMKVIGTYDGLIIRSRFPIDREFLDAAKNLKFIGRVGAGLENIDTEYARQRDVLLFNAPEGNRNAVGEHALCMLLMLMNKMGKAHTEVKQGIWLREENRGVELEGKTIGLYGYGNMGKAFARKLRGMDAEVICYDILGGVGDDNARQVGILEFCKNADVVSLHTPQTPETLGLVNKEFIDSFAKPFWFINTARGKSVVTEDLVEGLKSGKVLGAALDVLEYEKASFESLFEEGEAPESYQYLVDSDRVVLTPHIAGWTVESKEKLAQTIVDKIRISFFKKTSKSRRS
ncbi:hydroxyacid dehydrogenase [Robertkochia marina]|uniref:Hydroxyacid dehydrogenase n=1 Tax=Robertkochia marina TaxID=1227945 RepID=A0A4S3M4M4_9FLAO|nr:2-hydroxyacid dehydrogenase [Robertkochia marina]THD69639.1 hydroxyacid dehydrogenase [Robertkochia marina]TRZ47016.1 hydroxyacid dehydrogenase [Robertkochia marina]